MPRNLKFDEYDEGEQLKKQEVALPDCSQKIECLQDILNADPPGPIYQSSHKQLAKLFLQSGNEQQAVYHLSESHATTLRHQACSRIIKTLRQGNGHSADLQSMKERLSFGGIWQGINGLNKRFAELPCEWTVIQLTMEDDPLSRLPPRNRNVNRGLDVFITRLPCGTPSQEMSTLGFGWKPITAVVPPLYRSEGELSLTAAIRMHLGKLNEPQKKFNRTRIHEECSLSIEASAKEMETWLSAWHYLFLGRLVDKELSQEIKSAVDKSLFSLGAQWQTSPGSCKEKLQSANKESIKSISARSFHILYLCASSPFTTSSQIYKVSVNLFEDEKFAKYVSKDIYDIKCSFSTRLQTTKRYPVILVVDEDLDILPFEMVTFLEDHPVTRVPSIHFLHALYYLHQYTTMKNGIDVKNGFYVINPSNNIPRLDTMFKSLSLSTAIQQWKGVLNKPPSQDEFLKGLQESDIFLYCGHGGGNQFLPRDSVERIQVKAVVFLFGCSSSSMNELGGRVEMTSLYNSYLMAASPCVVGMLWQVLDEDVNAMTEKLLKVWCSPKCATSNESSTISHLQEDFHKLSINNEKGGEITTDLCEAVSMARKAAIRFLNKAAIVVRGLPLKVTSEI